MPGERVYDRIPGVPTPVEMVRELKDGFSPELGGLNEGAPYHVLRYVEGRLTQELERVREVLACYYGASEREVD